MNQPLTQEDMAKWREKAEFLKTIGIIGKSKPTTGVFSANSLEWIYEDAEDGIDLNFDEYCRHECPEDIDTCDCDYESDAPTYLIGFVYNEETGQYDIDPAAEYSAIINSNVNTVQVIKSIWYLTGGKCSPCYPGQVDADNENGDIPAYSVPPGVVGFADWEEKTHIVQKWRAAVELRYRINLLEHRELIEDGVKVWNRSDYEDYKHRDKDDRHSQNHYHVFLSEFNSGIVVADNAQEALDIAIDHATCETWEGLFLSPEDISELENDGTIGDYTAGGNAGRYLSSLNVAVQEIGTYPPVRQ